jgi:hypothetical protein
MEEENKSRIIKFSSHVGVDGSWRSIICTDTEMQGFCRARG